MSTSVFLAMSTERERNVVNETMVLVNVTAIVGREDGVKIAQNKH